MPLHETLRPSSRPSISVQELSSGWRIECSFGKVQPKDSVLLPDDLSVGSLRSGELLLDAKIYADNLSMPLSGTVKIDITVVKRSVTMDEIIALELDRLAGSHEQPDG